MDFLNTELLGNSVRTWLISAALLVAVAAAFATVRRFLTGRAADLSRRTETSLDDALAAAAAATKSALLLLVAVFMASRPLSLPERVSAWLGSLAIAGDLFTSLTILLDKPFVIGDSLAVDDLSGTVQSIGLNSTRLTSTTGEQLVFSNKDLLQSRIRN